MHRNRIRDLKRGYPWVFTHSLVDLPSATPGSFALLRDDAGDIFAKGMYDPTCQLAFRVCALEQELTDEYLHARIRNALLLRTSVLSAETTACRLINGEGDGLPGLICDRFDDTAVLQLDGAGPAGFWKIDAIAELIRDLGGVSTVYLKPRSGSDTAPRALIGKAPLRPTPFLEHGARYEADLVQGQKSGFFLDQRENRRRVRLISHGKTVLNLFSYTGGFSVSAGLGGASSVVSVDIAKPAIEAADSNWTLNGLSPRAHEAIAQNAFDFIEAARTAKRTFDIVIADPPSFAPSEAALEKGRNAYISLFSQCAGLLANNGILAASSCSSHIGTELFIEICREAISKARRRATVLGVHGQPLDHPFPLACRELQYLKFILLRVESD